MYFFSLYSKKILLLQKSDGENSKYSYLFINLQKFYFQIIDKLYFIYVFDYALHCLIKVNFLMVCLQFHTNLHWILTVTV